MADVSRVLFLRHLRGTPTAHVRHLRGGRVVHDGIGLAFWYRPRTAVISEIPLDDRELPLLFHARTADFQDVAVQATVTFRVVDPALAAARLDSATAAIVKQYRVPSGKDDRKAQPTTNRINRTRLR